MLCDICNYWNCATKMCVCVFEIHCNPLFMTLSPYFFHLSEHFFLPVFMASLGLPASILVTPVIIFSFNFPCFLFLSPCMNLGLPCKLPRSASSFPTICWRSSLGSYWISYDWLLALCDCFAFLTSLCKFYQLKKSVPCFSSLFCNSEILFPGIRNAASTIFLPQTFLCLGLFP